MIELNPDAFTDIPGFFGHRIDNQGQVISAWTRGGRGKRKIGVKWRRLKPSLSKSTGYNYVNLKQNGRRAPRPIHKLVLLTFVGPPPQDKPVTRHLNGVRTDNRLQNLVYGTHTENMQDRNEHGTDNRGERHGMSRFTKENVLAMRADYESDPSEGWTTRLATKYQTDPRTVHRIIRRERWKYV